MNMLSKFEQGYLTLQVNDVISSSNCKDKDLLQAIKNYQNKYNVIFNWVCTFNEKSIKSIQGSHIIDEYRPTKEVLLENSVYLLFQSSQNQVIYNNVFRMAEIATCYQPSNEKIRDLYRRNFTPLVENVFKDFFSYTKVIPEETLFVAPLRAGRFIANVGLGTEMGIPIYEIHTKRIYYNNNSVALGIEAHDLYKFSKYNHIIIGEGGIVSGVTIVSILNLLNKLNFLPKKFSICSIHASMYGIMNILKTAQKLGITLNIFTGITSYSISENLYSFYDTYPWKQGTLVTGDIGDYLSY